MVRMGEQVHQRSDVSELGPIRFKEEMVGVSKRSGREVATRRYLPACVCSYGLKFECASGEVGDKLT